jgi:hypothetical protein
MTLNFTDVALYDYPVYLVKLIKNPQQENPVDLKDTNGVENMQPISNLDFRISQ